MKKISEQPHTIEKVEKSRTPTPSLDKPLLNCSRKEYESYSVQVENDHQTRNDVAIFFLIFFRKRRVK